MTLEKILKSLEKGEFKKCYTTDECHRLIEVWYSAGGYKVALGGDASRYTASYKTVEELLKAIEASYTVKWTEFDYEKYPEPWELKEENARLKKALKIACTHLVKHCDSLCPFFGNDYRICITCESDVFEYLLKMAEKEFGNES